MTGRYPWKRAESISGLAKQISTREIDFSLIHTDQVRHCLKRMLDKDPATRATIDELICMDWVTNDGENLIIPELIELQDEQQSVGNMNMLSIIVDDSVESIFSHQELGSE